MSKNIILMDTNSIFTRLAYGLHSHTPELMNYRDFKHTILEMITEACETFNTNRVIMCMDGQPSEYWRKKEFPYYKENRKHIELKKGDLDYRQFAKDVIQPVIEDITTNLPMNYIKLEHTEADDIISILTMLFDEYKAYDSIIIWSGDSDFDQLKEYCETDIKRFMFVYDRMELQHKDIPLIEKIIRGDAGDGIPNAFMFDTFYYDKINGEDVGRQKPVTKKLLESINPLDYDIDVLKDEYEINHIERNQKLIDFRFIPEEIKSDIIEEYKKVLTTPISRDTIQEYINKGDEINLYLYKKLQKLFLN